MIFNRQRAVRSAEKMVARGKLRAAIQEYRKVLKRQPEDTVTLNRLGDLSVRVGELDDAVDAFRQAAEQFIRQGFLVKAIALYKKILRLDPARIEESETLAGLYHRQGLIQEARMQYQVVAASYMKRGNAKGAIDTYRKLLEVAPGDADDRIRLAELLETAGELEEAAELFRKGASLLLARDRVTEAAPLFEKALALEPEMRGFLGEAAEEMRSKGFVQEANRLLAASGRPRAGQSEAGPEEPAVDEKLIEEEIIGSERSEEEALEGDILVLDLDDEELSANLVTQKLGGLLVEGPLEGRSAGRESSDTREFEIDLEELEDQEEEPARAAQDQPEPVERLPGREDEIGVQSEPEAETGPEPDRETEPEFEMPAPQSVRPEPGDERVGELMDESEVLAKFGMDQRAADRLEELLGLDPEHPEAHVRLAELYLDLGRNRRVAELANRLARLKQAPPAVDYWEQLKQRLLEEGFSWDGGSIEPPEARSEGAAAIRAEPGPEIEQKEREGLEERWREGGPSRPPGPESGDYVDLAAELREELQEEGWDEEAAGPGAATATASPDGGAPDERPAEAEEMSQIVAGTVDEEDFETHFDLGIAYREMGLLDEAIGELQLAAKDPRYLVDSCSLLAISFLDKGFPELAIKWYRRGLESPIITEEETLGLLYDLAELHLASGDIDDARESLSRIVDLDPGFRDAATRLESIDSGE